MFKPKGWLDRLFAVGIVGKGIDGALELIGGLFLLLISPDRIYQLTVAVSASALDHLAPDPSSPTYGLVSLLTSKLVAGAAGLTGSAVTFGALYLLAHGVVKVVLVLALMRNKLWAYPWMIAVLLGFIGYQLYRIAAAPGVGLIVLTVFDALIVALTVREYRVQRRARTTQAVPPAEPDAQRRELVGAGECSER